MQKVAEGAEEPKDTEEPEETWIINKPAQKWSKNKSLAEVFETSAFWRLFAMFPGTGLFPHGIKPMLTPIDLFPLEKAKPYPSLILWLI